MSTNITNPAFSGPTRGPTRPAPAVSEGTRVVVGGVLAAVAATAVLIAATQNALLQHWSLIFIVLNLMLSIFTLVVKIRSVNALLSPFGLLCLFSVYFIGVAPFLHVANDYYLYIRWDNDGRDWVGYWLAAQFFGFLLIFWWGKPLAPTSHRIDPHYTVSTFAVKILMIIFAVTMAARAYQIISFGGISGIINAYHQRLDLGTGSENAFTGTGAITLIADMSQTLFSLLIVLVCRDKPWSRSSWFFWAYMFIVFAFSITLGGLRGSRGATVISLLFAALYFNVLIKPIRLNVIFFGIIGLALFMIVGSWYKFGGVEAVLDPQARAQMVKERHIEDEKLFVALRDFSRTDVQAYAMQQYMSGKLPPSLGRSYVGAVFYLIPRAVLPIKPPSFALEKTNMRYGEGYFSERGFTTLVMGQFAETLANFWIIGPVAFFIFLGAFVHGVPGRVNYTGPVTYPDLYAPILSMAPILLLTTDSNILVAKLLQFGFPIFLAQIVAKKS